MGFFDQYRTYVASSNMRLIENTPNIIQQAVHNAIMGGTDIVTDVTNTTINAFGRRGDRFYEYGRDHYYLGLPEGDFGKEVPKYAEVNRILNELYPQPEGYELSLITASIETLQWDFLGEMFIWNGGITPFEGKISNQQYKDYPNDGTYLTFENPDWFHGNQGSDTFRFLRCEYSTSTRAKFWYQWFYRFSSGEEEVREWRGDSEHFYPGFLLLDRPDEMYYHVTYTQRRISDGANMWVNPKAWMYRINSHDHPELDLDSDSKVNQYLPIVPLRVSNKDLLVPNNTAQYLTTKKILKIVELDVEELRAGINNNPDIADIDHAYFTFGIGMRSTERWALDYIYWFFLDNYAKQAATKSDLEDWKALDPKKGPPKYNTLTVSDESYNMVYFWYYVDRTEHAGRIGDIGHTTIDLTNDKGNFDKMSYKPNSSSSDREWDQRSIHDVIYIYRQITENTYVQLAVCGFTQYNHIYDTSKNVVTTVASKENEEVFLPVNNSYASTLSFLDRNSFYYASMRILINAYETVKLKWYQTGFFQFVTQVIAMAITVMTGGLGAFIQSLSVAISAGLIATGLFVAKLVLSGIVVKFGFEYLADTLGVEWAAIIAAVAVTYGALGSKGLLNLPFASDLTFVGTTLLKSGKEYLASIGEDIADDYSAMMYEYGQKQEELDAANELLETNSDMLADPLSLYTDVGMVPLESPSTYISRSLLPNPGLQSIDAISSFVDNSLRLPQFN